MKRQQQPPDVFRDQLVEVIGIGTLVFFGLVMLFFGWLRYKDRNNPTRTKPQQRPQRKAKRK